jgi:hypothetical protein
MKLKRMWCGRGINKHANHAFIKRPPTIDISGLD